MAGAEEANVERWEDIFQDEIIPKFAKMTDFRKFARSKRGLCLKESDIENAKHDYQQAEEQKLRLLYRWQFLNAQNATIDKIRSIVDDYFEKLRADDEEWDNIDTESVQLFPDRKGAKKHVVEEEVQCVEAFVEENPPVFNETNVSKAANDHERRTQTHHEFDFSKTDYSHNHTKKDCTDHMRQKSLKNEFQILHLEGEVWRLIRQEKYADALTLLAEILQLQMSTRRKIHALLLSVECSIMCDNHHSAIKNTGRMIEMMSSSTCDDIIELGQSCEREGKSVRAFVLYYAASKIVCETDGGDEAVRKIALCARYSRDIASALCDKGLQRVVQYHTIPYLNDTLEDLSSIHCMDEASKAIHKAWVLHHIYFCYSFCGQHHQADDLNQDAIDLMEKELGVTAAKKYRLYGLCLHHAGTAYYEAGHHRLAAKSWSAALDAFECTEDWKSNQQKKKKVDRTAKCLKQIKS